MATKQAFKRLTKEYKTLTETPPPYILARPNEDNILEWHYIITGPPDSPYSEGQYHGTLTFPTDYPYKPPAIRMITPNGRFKENTRLCLSMSDYHPDLWNPSWSVSTILTGLLSFMTGDEATTGSIVTTDSQKRQFAMNSVAFNNRQNTRFLMVFPDVVQKNWSEIKRREEEILKEKENGNNKNAKHSNDPILEASKEKVITLEEIMDPEDRIRAEQALAALQEEQKNKQLHKDTPHSSSIYYIVFAIFVFLLGLFMK
ncbi:ubiquitin-conjugating enzyme E2 NDAI_0E04170 [Naumovozyma dairenensis CBS 421]|uniref:Ubiquitin-conjugating enzyme E2 6 n=1 Tax=Naumovozyma dairenensis (strain ATCC 10597 / BCRC 20456 / CBS 421 / NBRC 0211 / NRRL Y-12639) TaxID=1071378 RepID=G0WBW4_NAUDC|nr:hypothetical protein NDAI_0E04170 [Naumovozyma dairenensis CBS 421]CCD25234.1 hypothetical protein NDAI_0E04170 [Naumovozyma dairenensis CBS 421]